MKAHLRAHELAPDDADITLGLGSLYAEMGRYEEATPMIQSMASTTGGNPLYFLLQADSLINENHHKEALPLLQQALAAKPDFPEAIATLAALQIDLDQTQKGMEMVKRALAAHSTSPDLHNSCGLLLAAQSKFPAFVRRL